MADARSAPESLPPAFLEFLQENGLDPMMYSMVDTIPRYIRLKPGMEPQIPEIQSELKCHLNKVSWLPDFYAIPPQVQIASSMAYQQGKIYGIDAASGAAVLALDVQPGEHVLDLCAAPDMLGGRGSLTGVDVAKHRLAACRTMLQKYSLGDRCRLFVADGTSFSILPVNSSLGNGEGLVGLHKCDALRPSADDEAQTSGYDKVLVDAECTHDGSIKHIQKFEFWGWKTLDRRVLDAERTDDLLHLQLRLLTNGFKLLKTGGSLLSTFNRSALMTFWDFFCKHAELQKIGSADSWPCRSGSIFKTLRFDPATSQTSGLFVAKFTKLQI
uniref:SAM-dependent MTase RsmB/NOP-type domain-containing protein n=1 Tax=Oryza meridionalis TaxID=40149 RepID=A0A0E0CJS0_9ORYZ